MSNQNDELYHYGVLGMKWGRRKSRMSQDASEARAIKKKKVSEMSNAELKRLNERQNLERIYKQNNKSKIAIGLAAAGTAISLLNRVGSIEDSFGKLERLSTRGKTVVDAIKSRRLS